MTYDIQNFQKDVIDRSRQLPVLVDFWAEWCGPCKILGPTLEKLAEEHKNEWAFAKVNTELHPDIAMKYNIRGIPNVKLFIEGQVADEFTGALPEPMIRDWLKKAMPNKFSGQLEQAKRLLESGDASKAIAILQTIMEAEPGNDAAKAMLAKLLIFRDADQAKLLARQLEGTEYHQLAEAVITLANLFYTTAHPEALPDAPVKKQYLTALEALRKQQFDTALQNFIEVIGTDRYYDNDGSRKAVIAIFKYLGEENELTRKHRSSFSSALYV